MNCFNHNDKQALGICKHCNKGICMECLTDLGDGIACTATCVEEVIMINNLISHNKKASKTTSGNWNITGIFYSVIGLLFIVTSIMYFKKLVTFFVVFGTIFLIFGIYTFIKARSFKVKNEDF